MHVVGQDQKRKCVRLTQKGSHRTLWGKLWVALAGPRPSRCKSEDPNVCPPVHSAEVALRTVWVAESSKGSLFPGNQWSERWWRNQTISHSRELAALCIKAGTNMVVILRKRALWGLWEGAIIRWRWPKMCKPGSKNASAALWQKMSSHKLKRQWHAPTSQHPSKSWQWIIHSWRDQCDKRTL